MFLHLFRDIRVTNYVAPSARLLGQHQSLYIIAMNGQNEHKWQQIHMMSKAAEFRVFDMDPYPKTHET